MATSTKPLVVVTDQGQAIVKYMGNPQGLDALICELLGTELANVIGLKTPDFAVVPIPSIDLPQNALTLIEPGPAFFSRWEETTSLSPDSSLLSKIRRPEDVAKLVAFDTLIRNTDRFSGTAGAKCDVVNYENVLLKMDKRKVQMLIIDHTHAFVETTLEDQLGEDWVNEETVYGQFPEFESFLTQKSVREAITVVKRVDVDTVRRICAGVPREWGMTSALADLISSCVAERARKLGGWLPEAIFKQTEMDI